MKTKKNGDRKFRRGPNKSQATCPLSDKNPVGIAELYRRCLAEEQKSTQLDLDKLKLILVRGLFFDRPLFEPPPTVDESSAINKETDLKIRRQLWEARKYRLIKELVRTKTRRKERLFILAWWLNQEEICKPEDIIGVEELGRRAKKLFPCFSTADFHHADAVRAWIPYFDRLIPESRVVKDSSKLMKQGYDEKAVWAALKKRSSIAAACEFLASRSGAGATLANAYSRLYGRKYTAFCQRFPSACH
ncbi:MAG: hypothetical protein WAL08_01325 [Candidatus Sulfotelmatobacter sp.]